MKDKGELLSVMLKRRININGEIHLDKVFTDLLIEMVEIHERQLDLATTTIEKMQDMLKSINPV